MADGSLQIVLSIQVIRFHIRSNCRSNWPSYQLPFRYGQKKTASIKTSSDPRRTSDPKVNHLRYTRSII